VAPRRTQVADGTLGEIDGFKVGLVERFPVHVLANDAIRIPFSVCSFAKLR
jgi:hypothetical protein